MRAKKDVNRQRVEIYGLDWTKRKRVICIIINTYINVKIKVILLKTLSLKCLTPKILRVTQNIVLRGGQK